MTVFSDDAAVMQFAMRLAERGTGLVEPNPAVAAVIVSGARQLIAAGCHERFGAAHAEICAIEAAGERCRGADLFVTLEPCSHFGKTPPCADAVIAAGFRRVVIGCEDPAPHVAGRGIARLREAGVEVVTGVCGSDAERLIAPFRMLFCSQRPWVHAKWAMSLDGRIATFRRHSRWISCPVSRGYVHNLRGRMDAIITGSGTVRADDPLLTARPSGPRTAVRVILNARGDSITQHSRLWQSVAEAPILVCVSDAADAATLTALQRRGIEVIRLATDAAGRLCVADVLTELGRRRCTHVLLEAGAAVTGAFFDAGLIDELHVFIGPKLIGGAGAISAIGGTGRAEVPQVPDLCRIRWSESGTDMLVRADVCR